MVKALSTLQPHHVRHFRPDVPRELDALIDRMLAHDPAERPSAVEAMNELIPFVTLPDDPPGSEAIRIKDTMRQLKGSLKAKDEAVRNAQSAVLYAMAKMAESHDGETEGHLRRMQAYVRVLVDQLMTHPDWQVLSDGASVAELIRCVPLHDIGKIGISDAILAKPLPLTPEETGGCSSSSARRRRDTRCTGARTRRVAHVPERGPRGRPTPSRALGRYWLPGPARRRSDSTRRAARGSCRCLRFAASRPPRPRRPAARRGRPSHRREPGTIRPQCPRRLRGGREAVRGDRARHSQLELQRFRPGQRHDEHLAVADAAGARDFRKAFARAPPPAHRSPRR